MTRLLLPALITPLLAVPLVLSLCTSRADARVLLQNDSFEPGDAVAFYTRINLEESFASVYLVPDDHARYRICRVLALVGPNAFNIYALRIGIAGDTGGEIANGLIWQNDDDAYQVFGAVDRFNAIDISAENIITETRRLRVQMQVYGGSEPNIAADSDGITPERNHLRVRLRNGRTHNGYTETMAVDGSPPQPPGDWVMRVEVVRPEENCPGPQDPPIENPPDDVIDFGGGPDDFGLDGGLDAMVDGMFDMMPDAMVEWPDAMSEEPDAMVEVIDAMAIDRDATRDATVRDARVDPLPDRDIVDRGRGAGPLELTRIAPTEGPTERNTDVIINGRGFLDGGGIVRAELGTTRLLEVEALSGSTLAAVVPAGLEAGTHELRLTRSDGQIAVLPRAFTVAGAALPPLRLDRISPNSVIAGRPAELTVEGAGFTDETVFSVGGAALQGVVIGPSEARGTLAVNLAPGIYDVVAQRGEAVVRLEQALVLRGQPSADGCRVAPGSGGVRHGSGGAGWILCGLGLVAFARRRR